MTIPGFQEMMLPILQNLSDGKEKRFHDIKEFVATSLKISDAGRKELLPSGRQTYFDNRVAWARIYLKKAGLIEAEKRGCAQITETGRQALAMNPAQIDIAFLRRYEVFNSFLKTRGPGNNGKLQNETEITSSKTPDEIIEDQISTIREHLEEEILKCVKNCSPYFFEKLVVDLLVRMGYGGSVKEAGQATKASGDEGIDGVIKEDRPVSIRFTFRRNGGKAWFNAPNFKSSRERCRVSGRKKEFSSLRLRFPRERSTTAARSTARSF